MESMQLGAWRGQSELTFCAPETGRSAARERDATADELSQMDTTVEALMEASSPTDHRCTGDASDFGSEGACLTPYKTSGGKMKPPPHPTKVKKRTVIRTKSGRPDENSVERMFGLSSLQGCVEEKEHSRSLVDCMVPIDYEVDTNVGGGIFHQARHSKLKVRGEVELQVVKGDPDWLSSGIEDPCEWLAEEGEEAILSCEEKLDQKKMRADYSPLEEIVHRPSSKEGSHVRLNRLPLPTDRWEELYEGAIQLQRQTQKSRELAERTNDFATDSYRSSTALCQTYHCLASALVSRFQCTIPRRP